MISSSRAPLTGYFIQIGPSNQCIGGFCGAEANGLNSHTTNFSLTAFFITCFVLLLGPGQPVTTVIVRFESRGIDYSHLQ